MKTTKFTYFIIASLFISLSSCINFTSKITQQLAEEYMDVPRDSAFYGIVDTCFVTHTPINNSLHISLIDGLKFNAIANTYPTDKDILNVIQFDFDKENISDLSLRHFLQKGDTIYKKAGKDSLVVLRGSIKYRYLLSTKEFHDSVSGPDPYVKMLKR